MDTIAPAMTASPAELRHRRVRLELGHGAVAHACGHVRETIVAWSVPVNQAVAILLTSDLVINAVTSQAAISSAGDPRPRDISAETIKMPDPIIEPITIAVAENSPIPCTN